jgi:formiminotetrahydrofolate cyclodeaminase
VTTTPEAPGSTSDRSTPSALSAWLERLAQADGGQGGGAACGVMLSISAALMEMVARYSTEDERAAACTTRLAQRSREALAAAEADGIRSSQLGASLRAPESDPARDRGIHEAALAAAASSAELGAVGVALVAELALLSDIGNPAVTADLAVAAEALSAGLAGSGVNLRADLALAEAHAADETVPDAARRLAEAAQALVDARDAASAYAERLSATFGSG